ncbi:MAG: hypothetical protein ACC631_12520, partial [Halocynthiibacter sp.]
IASPPAAVAPPASIRVHLGRPVNDVSGFQAVVEVLEDRRDPFRRVEKHRRTAHPQSIYSPANRFVAQVAGRRAGVKNRQETWDMRDKLQKKPCLGGRFAMLAAVLGRSPRRREPAAGRAGGQAFVQHDAAAHGQAGDRGIQEIRRGAAGAKNPSHTQYSGTEILEGYSYDQAPISSAQRIGA